MQIAALAALVDGLDGAPRHPADRVHRRRSTPDSAASRCFRHLAAAVATRDHAARWSPSRRRHGFAIFLQPGGIDSVHAAVAGTSRSWRSRCRSGTSSCSSARSTSSRSTPASTSKMIAQRAVDLLDPQPDDRVLDLFCGLGNFTLPLARRAARSGRRRRRRRPDRARARERRAQRHRRTSSSTPPTSRKDLAGAAWMRAGFDRLLLDPPRSGAAVVLTQLPLKGLKRIVYVSCHPGLAGARRRLPGQRARLEAARGRRDGHVPAHGARGEHRDVRTALIV